MELIIYITITLLIASGYATFNMFRKMERLEKIVDQQNQYITNISELIELIY